MKLKALFTVIATAVGLSAGAAPTIYLSGNANNDLYDLLVNENISVERFDTPQAAIDAAEKGAGVIITAPGYPKEAVRLNTEALQAAKKKGLKLYAEFVAECPGVEIDSLYHGSLERAVISSDFFKPQLQKMDLLAINDCYIYTAKVKNPLISYARVAGFDKAMYGLTDTDIYPLLWKNGNTMLAFSDLTRFKTGRYEPRDGWKAVWTHILQWLTGDKKLEIKNWVIDPHPTYTRDEVLAPDARRKAIERGADWLWNARLFIHPTWKAKQMEYMGDGILPVGPRPDLDALVGDGCLGVLEGHMSDIRYDGTENYRYWLRADVQGEVAYLLSSAANLLDKEEYKEVAEHLLDYLFYSQDYIADEKLDPKSDAYGLIGWSITHPNSFYNDDNARCVLGAIGASSLMDNQRWNQFIVENILANFRLSSKNGFLPYRFEQEDLLKNGRKFYSDSDLKSAHPHYDSWMLACYLWLYDKTSYKPLLEKTEKAIEYMMSQYPDKWQWTNGIQQERARMILPLAWLVRVDDTPEHRQWLDMVVNRVLENQDESGAIREELGGEGFGDFAAPKSNREYGLNEAPLIAENGDPVADMLYTSNFGFFALNEAAHATGDPKYKEAVDKLSDFLVRIQASSKSQPDLDGAWMRAFDFDNWDYWASNADHGWGAWSTLTGWIQSWIVGTQALVENNESYWDKTKNMNVGPAMEEAKKKMLE